MNKNFLKELINCCNENGIDKNIQTTIALIEIEAEYGITKGEAIKILQKIKSEREVSVAFFEQEARKLIRKQPNENWKMFIPINLNMPMKSLKFKNKKIYIRGKKEVQPYFAEKEVKIFSTFKNDKRTKPFDVETEYFIEIDTSGENLLNGLYNEISTIEEIQGIVNYSLHRHYISYAHPFWSRKVDFKVELKIYAISSSDRTEYLEFKVLNPEDKNDKNSPPKTISDREKNEIEWILKLFTTEIKEKSLNELILYVFRLYNSALHSLYLYSTFLMFWQVLETITLSNEFNGKTSEVIKRIKIFTSDMNLIEGKIDNTLKKIAEIRNDIVHRGIDAVNQDYINILKCIVDDAILWLLNNIENIDNANQLNLYYKMHTINSKELNDNIKINALIQKERDGI